MRKNNNFKINTLKFEWNFNDITDVMNEIKK
jgi:hypothetical protein